MTPVCICSAWNEGECACFDVDLGVMEWRY